MRYIPILLCVACTYTPLKITLVDSNEPPVAVIDGGPSIEVGANTVVILSGEGFDPEGEQLIFLWSVTGSCTTGEISDASIVKIHTGAPDSRCEVTLTVTDEGGLTGEASATLIGVDVGTYVGPENCTSYDPASFIGAGSQTNPWCTIEDGATVALAFQIASVFVSTGTFEISEPLLVPSRVTFIGGLDGITTDGDDASWAPLGERWKRTNIGLLDSAVVQLHGGAPSTLRGFAVYRVNGLAAGDTVLVDIRHRRVTIESCTIGESREANQRVNVGESANADVSAVRARNRAHLVLRDSHIVMADVAMETAGVYLDGIEGVVSGEIVNTTIDGTPDAYASVGVRLIATRDVQIIDSNISITGTWHDSTTVIGGVVDGGTKDIRGISCAGNETSCTGSSGLRLENLAVTVQNPGGLAAGVALFGSNDATLTGNSVITVSGNGSTTALWSIETRNLFVAPAQDGTVSLNATSTFDYPAKSAVGYLDGVPIDMSSPGPIEGGSMAPRLEQVYITVYGSGAIGNLVAGAVLLGTEGQVDVPTLDTIVFDIQSNAGATHAITGSWTVDTHDVSLANSQWLSVQSAALTLAAAHLDGWRDSNQHGSTGLVLQNNVMTPVLSGTAETGFVCIGLFGASAAVSNNIIDCSLPAESTSWLHQVWSVDSGTVEVVGNIFDNLDGISVNWLQVAIRDGWDTGAETPRPGSDNLVIERNLILPGRAHNTSVGIMIDHSPNDTGNVARIVNNAVRTRAELAAAALVIRHANAQVINNTLHGGECLGLTDAVSIYAPQRQIEINNNILDAGGGLYPNHVRDESAEVSGMNVITGVSVSSFENNRLVELTTGSGCYYMAVDLACVTTVDTFLSGFGFESTETVGDAGLCPDGYHLDPMMHDDTSTIRDQAAEAPGIDIDGAPRDNIADIGADEITTGLCP